jgi:hypothetical protein
MGKITYEEMAKLFKATVEDLTIGKRCLDYDQDISKSLLTKYPEVIGYGRTFWSNTVMAYREAMTMHLMRAYDRDDKSIGLKCLLKCIEDNISLFPVAHHKF